MNMKRVVLWGLVFCLIWAGCGVAGETGGCEIAVPDEFNVSASRAAFDGVWDKAVAEAKAPKAKKRKSEYLEKFNELTTIGKSQVLYLYSLLSMNSEESVKAKAYEDMAPVRIIYLKETLESYTSGNALRQVAVDGSLWIYGNYSQLDEFKKVGNTGQGGIFVEQLARCFDGLWFKAFAKARQAGDVKTYNLLVDSRWSYYRDDVYQCLKDFGKNVNERDKDGMTPLIWACSLYDREEIVQALMDAGANVDARDNEGGTALMNAACQGYTSVVELLLKSGANPNLETTGEYKYTALNYAAEQGHIQIFQVFKRYGVSDITIRRAKIEALEIVKSIIETKKRTIETKKRTIDIKVLTLFVDSLSGGDEDSKSNKTKHAAELKTKEADLKTKEADLKTKEADLKTKEAELKKLQTVYCSDPELSKLDVCKCQ